MKKKIVIALLFLVLAISLCYGATNTLDNNGLLTTTGLVDRLNHYFFVDADDTSDLIGTVEANRIVVVPDGEYDFTSGTGALNVNTSTDYIIFDGHGKTVINVTDTLTSEAFSGAQSKGSDVDVTVNVAVGDRKITVASTSGLAKDDRIILHSNKALGSGSVQGEQLKIYNISGSNIYLTEPTYFSCLTANDCNISKIDGVKNIIIRNFIFQGENATDGTHIGIRLRGAENVFIYDNEFKNLGSVGIALHNTFNAHIFRNTFSNINYRPAVDGYGISVSEASRHINIYDNLCDSMQECFDSGSTNEGIPLDISIYDNTFMNIIDVAVDSHNQSREYNIRDNVFIGNRVDVRVSGEGFQILGNEFRDTTAQAVYVAGTIANNTVIDSNVIIDNQNIQGAIDVLSTKNVYITNNFFKDVILGVRAVYSTDDIIVSNNIFVDSTTGTNITASTGTIQDNVFSGVTTPHVNTPSNMKNVYGDMTVLGGNLKIGSGGSNEELSVQGSSAVKIVANSSDAYGMLELWGAEGQSPYITAYADQNDDSTDNVQFRFNDGGVVHLRNAGAVKYTFTTASGELKWSGIESDGADRCLCIKADGNVGTCACGSCSCT